jgi:hypothetical protein
VHRMSTDEDVLVFILGSLRLTAVGYSAAHGSAVRLTVEPLPPPRQPRAAGAPSPAVFRSRAAAPPVPGRAAPAEPLFYELETPEACPDHLLQRSGLLSEGGGLTGRQRLIRAYNLGRGAARFLRGDAAVQFRDPLSLRNTIYVVLDGLEPSAAPFFTLNLNCYYRAVCFENTREFVPTTCSQAFPSREEAKAFCFGAGLSGLPVCR